MFDKHKGYVHRTRSVNDTVKFKYNNRTVTDLLDCGYVQQKNDFFFNSARNCLFEFDIIPRM